MTPRLAGFEFGPTLESDRVRLEPLREDHFPALAHAASDPATWADHPAKDRWKADAFARYFTANLLVRGGLVALDRHEDRVVGCSRFYPAWNADDAISIGYTFIERRLWGTGLNGEMKALMLDHAFGTFPEVWFHIAPSNLRSRRAVEKLGATLHEECDAPDGMSRACYRLSAPA